MRTENDEEEVIENDIGLLDSNDSMKDDNKILGNNSFMNNASKIEIQWLLLTLEFFVNIWEVFVKMYF